MRDDLISRKTAIEEMLKCGEYYNGNDEAKRGVAQCIGVIHELPSAQPEKRTETHACDCISRRAAIEAIMGLPTWWADEGGYYGGAQPPMEALLDPEDAVSAIENLPSAQPERTCVNCGRTANNGGWYADGGTRCPIEEHYALPKDGYCHLWEKRNVTDDDYPERRTDG